MSEIFIRTVSGKLIDILHLKPGDVSIEDIAHALSQLNRFGGHTAFPYSVAQHSVFVAHLALKIYGPDYAYPALMHDIQEGVGCVDLPSPVKRLCPDYVRVENRVEEQLAVQFRSSTSTLRDLVIVKACDKRACDIEQHVLRNVPLEFEDSLRHLADAAIWLQRMEPEDAEALFLEWYEEWRPF